MSRRLSRARSPFNNALRRSIWLANSADSSRNTREYAAWLQMLLEGQDPVEGTESLDTDAVAIEQAYLGLRTSNGLGLNPANAGDFGRWKERGWAKIGDDRGYLTPSGWLRLDSLVADLTDVRSR